MAQYLHANPIDTIVGKVAFNDIGDWTKRRTLMIQIQNVKGNDINQFREPGKQVILDPAELKSGNLITPYNAARKAS